MKDKIFILILIMGVVFFATDAISGDLILQGELNEHYVSDSNIYTQGSCFVEPESAAVLEAPSGIILYPGFRAKSKSRFYACIGYNLNTDTDDLPDGWELLYFGNLDQGRDDDSDVDPLTGDPNPDSLTNIEEYLIGTDPSNPDTDGDGMSDGWENFYGPDLDPKDPSDADDDPDNDNLTNLMEYRIGSDPTDNSNPASGVYYDYDKLGRIKRIIRKQ